VCLGSLAADELAKRQEKKEKVAETKQNVTQQKGKNFGLGGFDKGMVRARVVYGCQLPFQKKSNPTQSQSHIVFLFFLFLWR